MSRFLAPISAINARVSVAAGAIPTQYPNAEPVDKPDTSEWLRVTHLVGASRLAAYGGTSKLHRTDGVTVIAIFTPAHQGAGRAYEIADQIDDAFRLGNIADECVRFSTPDADEIGVEGSWYHINVSVPWTADTLKERATP